MQRLRKFLRLPTADQRLLLTALLLVARFSVQLRLKRKYAWKELLAAHDAARVPRANSPERICWAIQTASRWVPGGTCLVQSLAALTLLQRAGYSARLRLGAKLNEQQLCAHAWVESEGKALFVIANGSPFVPFETHPLQ